MLLPSPPSSTLLHPAEPSLVWQQLGKTRIWFWKLGDCCWHWLGLRHGAVLLLVWVGGKDFAALNAAGRSPDVTVFISALDYFY